MANSQPYDIVIIGGGIAGLSVALRLPDSMRIALFTKGQLGESNTRYAQGGLSVALGTDDSPELHFQDTIAAGAGLCDEHAVRVLVEEAPAAVRWLIEMGVQFDRAQPCSDAHTTSDGLLLGREAAHSRWRVLHAGGDATGAEIERALMSALRKRSSITLYEETFVSNLLVQDGICAGLQAIDRDGHAFTVESRATILASGGAGGLWLHTSNPSGATADGLSLAWRAGAALTDLEFMQFHPTVLVANGTSHLVSEAVRGEGAYLRNHAGERFMPKYHSLAELAPRDVVARAILNEMLTEGTDCQYLDLHHLSAEPMYARFPTISAICRQYGLDLVHDLLPVAPNRLASNSLLEGLVFGLRLADGLLGVREENEIRPTMPPIPALEPTRTVTTFHSIPLSDEHVAIVEGDSNSNSIEQIRRELRQVMWQYVSLSRDQQGLLQARRRVHEMLEEIGLPRGLVGAIPYVRSGEECHRYWEETRNMLIVAELVIAAALQRCESRGSHWRRDYETLDETLNGSHYAFQRVNFIAQGDPCDRLRDFHDHPRGRSGNLQEVVPHA